MHRRTLVLLAAVLGLTLAVPAHAQWKWRDQKGQTQYSDLPPPPGVAEQDILGRPNHGRGRTTAAAPAAVPASGSAGAHATAAAASGIALAGPAKAVDPDLEARRKKAEAEQAARSKAEEAKLASARADNCVRARSQLQSLDSGVRIMRTNERGEREFLDDKQRADESRRTREVIASDCK